MLDDPNYLGVASGTLVIAKAAQSVTLISSAISFTFGGGYTAMANSGFGAFEWSLGTGSTGAGGAIDAVTGTVTATSLGTVMIKVRFAGDANHNPSSYTEEFTVTINPAATTFAPLHVVTSKGDLVCHTYRIIKSSCWC
jgi:hypothetical protein